MSLSPLFLDVAIVFLPLLGAALAGFGGHRLGDKGAQAATCVSVFLSALLSAVVFDQVALHGAARTHVLLPWIEAGDLKVNWALRVDSLTAVMMLVVTCVSAMVHLYAVGYMKGDKGVPRFMAFLSLFTFFMLMLVSADNLLQLFFGWEGVGLSSYLLIGFWFQRPKACAAAMKAFLVNRVGDFGFLLGVFGCYQFFGSLDFNVLFDQAPQVAQKAMVIGSTAYPALTVLTLLLFVGAMGKSAQIGLHTWLPDAMEGPTPVSALIHAATMVTAGVFMVARLSPLFEYAPATLAVVSMVGAVTAVFAGSIAMTQFDIKRVIAYSTMSQLGYMFFAAGVSAYGAAIFHLMTHAFFKALLFLAAGSVIHAMHGQQDMRRMGGLWRKLPVTYGLMWIGLLALAGIGIDGVFGFSGFYSKDMILDAAFRRGTWFGATAFGLGLAGAFMTGFYAWRLLILTFHGKPRDAETAAHAHEAPWTMLGPMLPLALGAVFAGLMGHALFASAPGGDFWHGALFVAAAHTESATSLPWFIKLAPPVLALLGIGFSCWLYLRRPEMPAKIAQKLGPVHDAVSNRFYFDELYDLVFVRFVHWLSHALQRKGSAFDRMYDFLIVRMVQRLGATLWRRGDEALIDRIGPDGVAALSNRIGRMAQKLQTGYVYHYAFVMMCGLIVLAGWALARSG